MIRVDELNALNGEPVFGITKFSDLTQEEMKNMKGLIRPDKDPEPHEIKLREGKSFGLGLPSMVNWVTAGMTTPIKNQGQCGACWAFAVASQIESQWAMQGNTIYEFSPQWIASCTQYPVGSGAGGCGGGWYTNAYNQIAQTVYNYGVSSTTGQYTNNGLPAAAFAPFVQSMYQGCSDMSCTYNCNNYDMKFSPAGGPYASISLVNNQPQATIFYGTAPCASGSSCGSQNSTAVVSAIAQYGPAAIIVNAASWNSYTGGVLTQTACGSYAANDMDHAVQLVGYNAQATSPYWIVRNQWDTNWGMGGYIYLQYPQNTCGLLNGVTQTQIANMQQTQDPF